MSKQKLLPCPFCSGEPELLSNTDRCGVIGAFVLCKACDAESGYATSASEAITKWNTRHEPKREFVVNQTKGGE